jgi:uncharacterized membrane protein SpoIIM required for sporulation/ABC-type transport system involved in multi-copper enzyme maturation permease subunit
MLADLAPVGIIARREIRDQMRDWRIIFPILILTVVFPGLMNFTATQATGFINQYGAPLIASRLIPFLLMVVGFFPMSFSLVIALESFVGEKERRSIEPLLSSPLEDWQLYIGKLIAAMVPPLAGSYLGISVYLIGVRISVNWSPAPIFLLQVLLLTTVQAIVMVSGAVVVSSQTTSVRAANLLASFILIPVAFLIQGESIIMFWGQYDVLWWIILAMSLVAGLLIRTGVAHFNREELLGRELDSLNLVWAWRIFRRAFTGQQRSWIAWYRYEVTAALRRIRGAMLAMLIILLLGVWAGASQAWIFRLPAEALNLSRLDRGFIQGLGGMRFFSAAGIGAVLGQNLRAVLLASLLGVFSFGVFGVIVLMLPITIISYAAANIALAGYSPLLFLTALVLPHGLFEIPAILLSGAAILWLGAALATPAHGKTIGEAWLLALADWAKITLGVAAPLFAMAAIMEVFVTPRLAVFLLTGQ